jgi:hypothetical protein
MVHFRESFVKIRMSFAALAAIASLAFAAAPASAADKDCAHFKTWRQAQNFYKKHGGPRYDHTGSTLTTTASPARTCATERNASTSTPGRSRS